MSNSKDFYDFSGTSQNKKKYIKIFQRHHIHQRHHQKQQQQQQHGLSSTLLLVTIEAATNHNTLQKLVYKTNVQ